MLAARRDLAIVCIATPLVFAFAALTELNERVLHASRPFEHYQLDELPFSLLMFSLGMAWFSWRRWGEARDEIRQRLLIEAELERSRIELRELSHQSMAAQEGERSVLARELHDEMGQTLNAIKIEAVTIRNASRANDHPNHHHLRDVQRAAVAIIGLVDQVYTVVRQINQRLRPVALDELGLTAALEHCVDGWRERLPHVQFTLNFSGAVDALAHASAIALYRVVQESLTNMARHSQASEVSIRLSMAATASEVQLKISDNGCGADLEIRPQGFGLIGMRERIDALGGKLDISSQPRRGLTISVSLPVVAGATPS